MTRSYIEDDFDFDHVPDKSLYVHEDQPSAVIKYPKPNGGYFKVRVIQKPNPIGFRARLPGKR